MATSLDRSPACRVAKFFQLSFFEDYLQSSFVSHNINYVTSSSRPDFEELMILLYLRKESHDAVLIVNLSIWS